MRLQYAPEDEAFRVELVDWLTEHAPGAETALEPKQSSAHMPEWARQWQRLLFDEGWLVPGWPPALGGRNATPTQQMIYFEEMSKREVTRSANPQGLGIIAPSIKDYGTEAQQAQFLLPTLRAEVSWCLGMSEPNAGSDLASLATRAELVGDEFVVNGQKVWTSGAHHADWCLCFVRTNPDVPKHKGISALIIDTTSPGVERRPFAELSDPDMCDFNEVYFDDVRVPRENLLGPLDGGWPITQGSLAHERAMLWIGYAYDLQRAVAALVEMGDREAPGGGRLGDDPRFRDAVASFHVDAQALLAMGYRGFAKFLLGKSSPEHSLLKLYSSEALQRALMFAAESLGGDGLDLDVPGFTMWRDGSWMTQYLRSFGGTIPGGTSEVQRNIIAERVLGLPRR
ncbi:MAG: acyl-CoA dehydrogenase family protein [Actinomycetota bacterium]|nr:acyl-CoA dehydrogenase family protein [Actinomycetota bacterium]